MKLALYKYAIIIIIIIVVENNEMHILASNQPPMAY